MIIQYTRVECDDQHEVVNFMEKFRYSGLRRMDEARWLGICKDEDLMIDDISV